MPKIAVYGSLRKGEYNLERFMNHFPGEISVQSVGLKVNGYDLYSLGMYPGIIHGDGHIIVDILEVSDNVKKSIDSMEKGAGYSIESINIDDSEPITIYVYNYSVDNLDKVESGDWSEHLNNLR